ncbi:MAG TPA: VWA domain-containing protein [Acidimicrobiales bacterium]|nr:VWA domain-containing protein [Acidimicrobiales bacterium]
MARARYSRWDGSQEVDDATGDDILRQLMDELAEHGDADQALRRLMQQGFVDGSGRDVAGLRELLERVRRRRGQLARRAFNQVQEAMARATPEQLRRTAEMLAQLNELIEAQRGGRDVQDDFERFMARYGDLVPGHPATLDELLETIAQELAEAQALLGSMTPEQRAKLAELSEALLEDDGYRSELGRLAANLAAATSGFGHLGAPSGLALGIGLGPSGPVVGELADLAQLEQLLAAAPSPGALAEVDIERARELLGDEDARSLEALGELARRLREAGLVEHKEGRLRLTPRGLRRLGDQALADLYTRLSLYRSGQHPVGRPGAGHERAGETKPYEWGDPFNLSITGTVRNALARRGPGAPVELSPEDFEIERTEALSRSATVIMLDLSLSMPMRGNFVAAKKMVLALHSLISGRFPSDYLGIVGFSRYARQISVRELPEVSWDFDWGTNIQHGLAVARQLLSQQRGTRQIVMVTDGEPTAHWPAGATEPVFAYPPTQQTLDATLVEVARCTREGIRVNTFALDATGHLRHFVEQLTRLNRGKAFFTTPSTLGDYVLADFLEQRRMARRRRRPA